MAKIKPKKEKLEKLTDEEIKERSTYFGSLTCAIFNLASKMDSLFFGGIKDKQLFEDICFLQLFHFSVFKEKSKLLEKFIANFEEKENLKDRKELGAFFTPRYIVEYMVKETIGPLFKEKSIEDILKLTICDPSMGGGVFLVGVHNFLMEAIINIDENIDYTEISKAASRCVYGVDLNPNAVKGSILTLNLNIAKWSIKKAIEKYQINLL